MKQITPGPEEGPRNPVIHAPSAKEKVTVRFYGTPTLRMVVKTTFSIAGVIVFTTLVVIALR